MDENKKWKSTREAQTYQLKRARSSSKLMAAKDSSNGANCARQASVSSHNSRKKVTPNHMLNFSKQLNASANESSSLTPNQHSVMNSRSVLALAAAAQSQERAEPHSTMAVSPSKKHVRQ